MITDNINLYQSLTMNRFDNWTHLNVIFVWHSTVKLGNGWKVVNMHIVCKGLCVDFKRGCFFAIRLTWYHKYYLILNRQIDSGRCEQLVWRIKQSIHHSVFSIPLDQVGLVLTLLDLFICAILPTYEPTPVSIVYYCYHMNVSWFNILVQNNNMKKWYWWLDIFGFYQR